MKTTLAGLLPDALMTGGAAVFSFGAWLIYPPVGYLVAGAFLLAAGWLSARSVGK